VAKEFFKPRKEIIKVKKDEFKTEIVRRKAKKVSFVFFGSMAITGFIISLITLIDMIVFASRTVGIFVSEGYLYGLLILVVASFIAIILLLSWYAKFKRDYLAHKT
jgi:hypothetical protein